LGDALAVSPLLISSGMVNAHILGSLWPATRVAEKVPRARERCKSEVLQPDHNDQTSLAFGKALRTGDVTRV
jgi:hypothetical protein